MKINCQTCNKELALEGNGHFICPYCGFGFEIGEGSSYNSNRTIFPWTFGNNFSFFKATIKTLNAVLFKPSSFFSGLPLTLSYTESAIFGIIFYTLGFFFSALNFLLWKEGILSLIQDLSTVTSMDYQLSFTFDNDTFSPARIYMALLPLMPLLATVYLFFFSICFHILLKLVGAAKKPFKSTFNTICFTKSATKVFILIPYFGNLIEAVWSFFLTIKGLKEVHSSSTARILFAISLPLIFFFFIMILLLMGVSRFLSNFQLYHL